MTQQFLSDEVRTQLTQALSAMTRDVELVVYTASNLTVPGRDEPGLQVEALQLLREVASTNDHITVSEKAIGGDHDATSLGITRGPTILMREAGSDRTNIRFLGLPSGYEFGTLVETLKMLGTGESDLGEKSRAQAARIDSPVLLQSFVTPTCPYCPRAVLAAYKLAFHNPHVIAEGVEANEFPVLSNQFGISSVPDTIISGQSKERVLGGQPDRVFVEAALKAAGVAA
jgi:glutaredoxin-like protein